MQKKYILPFSILFLWITLFLCFYISIRMSSLSFEEIFFWIIQYIQNNKLLGIAIFIAMYILRPLFFIIAAPFDILSGAIFWFWLGSGVSLIATLGSICFSYFIGYSTGWKLLEIPKKFLRIKKIEAQIHKRPFFHIIMLRFLLFPFDLLNYLSGVFKISFRPFLLASFLGTCISTIITVGAGSAFHEEELNSFSQIQENIEYKNLVYASIFLVLFLIISQGLKRYFRYKTKHIF